jgi:ABC-type antimicrobial peptide transport system permease subunit
LLLAKLMTLAGDPTNGFLPFFYISPASIGAGLLCTIVIGILSTILPATSAMRLRVVDALRRV